MFKAFCKVCRHITESSSPNRAKQGIKSHMALTTNSGHQEYDWDNIPEIPVERLTCENCGSELKNFEHLDKAYRCENPKCKIIVTLNPVSEELE